MSIALLATWVSERRHGTSQVELSESASAGLLACRHSTLWRRHVGEATITIAYRIYG